MSSLQYQQFVDDYLIVVDNDSSAWAHHADVVVEQNYDAYAIADVLRDEFEFNVSLRLDRFDPSHIDYTSNIIREMLLGWGSQPYENITRELIHRIKEGK